MEYTVQQDALTGGWTVSNYQRRLGPAEVNELLERHFSEFDNNCCLMVQTVKSGGFERLYLDLSAYYIQAERQKLCEYFAGFYNIIGIVADDQKTAEDYKTLLESRITWRILKRVGV